MPRSAAPRVPPALFLLATFLLLALPRTAAAYPWMVQHGYTTCSACHVDPSGAGALTGYGRAQGEVLLRMHYGEPSGEDPGDFADFLFGAVPLPEAVIAQADVRYLVYPRPAEGGGVQVRNILMQSDLRGGVQTDFLVAQASIGVVSEGAFGARLLRTEDGADPLLHPVSREHWVGITPAKELLIRAGRMNLPFGIRTDQHLMFTRATTRTTINDDQQLGLAVAYAQRKWRAEIMGIAGNFAVSPAAYRERGYSGYFAWMPENNLELGVSSLLATSELDVQSLAPLTRQAHGVFARWSPMDHLALFAEADLLLNDPGPDLDGTSGFVVEVHGDWEATQGLHVKAGGELCDPSSGDDSAAIGRGWGALQWFFLPRVDLRIDALYGPLYCTPGAESRPAATAQLHFFL